MSGIDFEVVDLCQATGRVGCRAIAGKQPEGAVPPRIDGRFCLYLEVAITKGGFADDAASGELLPGEGLVAKCDCHVSVAVETDVGGQLRTLCLDVCAVVPGGCIERGAGKVIGPLQNIMRRRRGLRVEAWT